MTLLQQLFAEEKMLSSSHWRVPAIASEMQTDAQRRHSSL